MAIYRTDVDAIAAAYVKNRVNGNINPYHSGWAPAWVDMSRVGAFSGDPNESHPSWYLSGPVRGDTFRQQVVNLGVYYGWIAKGHYGLLTTLGFITVIQFEGTSYFVLNGNAGGAIDHYNSYVNNIYQAGIPGGPIRYQSIIDWYDFVWNTLNNHKEDLVADLVVCHSSCHLSCHGSRGRR